MKISCKTCGANLKFVPSIQKACCEHCGNIYEPEAIEYCDSVYDECEKYTCNSCGAELISFDKTGVVNCLYCKGKEFVKGKSNKEYILQGVFPFKVAKEQFIESYKEYFKTLSNIEDSFKKKIEDAKVISVYLPYSFANNFFRNQYPWELNELLEEIIPFDFKELKNMNPIYLDNCFAEIIKTKKKDNLIKTKDGSFYWVPIWLAEIEFKNTIYYIVMNGQTWEMAGYYCRKQENLIKKKMNIRKILKIISMIFKILLEIILFQIIAVSKSITDDIKIIFLFLIIINIIYDCFKILNHFRIKREQKFITNKMKKKSKLYTFFRVTPQQNKIRNR